MRRSRSGFAANDPADFDGGIAETYQRMIEAMDAQVGRVLAALDASGLAEQHHRDLHQRQRRRALRRHLALHRHEDRTAGRRPADSRDHLLAGAYSAGPTSEQVTIEHGLAADAAGRRRHERPTPPIRPTA